MLITTSRAGDQIAKNSGRPRSGWHEAGLRPIFRTDRYVLVEISETKPPDEGDQQNSNEPRTSSKPGDSDLATQPERLRN